MVASLRPRRRPAGGRLATNSFATATGCLSMPKAPLWRWFIPYFNLYAVPPTDLHEAIQEAAVRAGWSPPWHSHRLRAQKKVAGKRSGSLRGGRQAIRRHFVEVAFSRLKPAFRAQPYSDHTLDELRREYRNLFPEADRNLLMQTAPFKASRETLKNDLKKLGIRSKRRQK